MQNVVLTSPRKNQESDLHLSSFRVLLPADWPNRRLQATADSLRSFLASAIGGA